MTTAAAQPARPAAAPTGPATTVRIESVPGAIAAVNQWHTLGQQISDGMTALGISPQAQRGLLDAIDSARSCATAIAATYRPLVEASDATPQGAGAVTVQAARTE